MSTIVLFSSLTQAQSLWRDGYIVSLTNDTSEVSIKSNFGKKRFLEVIVKRNSNVQKYNPTQLLGYGFKDGKKYSSEIVKSSFVEILLIGEVSLYRLGGVYYLKSNQKGVIELSEGTVQLARDNGYKRKNKQWKGMLLNYISDCEITAEEVQEINLNEAELILIIKKYNTCRGSNFEEVKESIPKLKVGFGMYAGVRSSTLEVFNDENLAGLLNNNYTSKDQVIGISASFLFPRLSNRSHFEAELRYTTSQYSSFVSDERPGFIIEQYEPVHNIDLVQLPVSFRYYLLRSKTSIFIQPGISFHFVVNSSSQILFDRITQSSITTENRSYLSFIKRFFTAWGRAGVTYQTNNLEIGLVAELFSPMTNFVIAPDGFISSLKQSSIGLIIALK